MQSGERKRIAIACQGGGSHTSFTAGALKGLLARGHEKYDFVAFSGTSGGAVCALLAWYALLERGAGEAGAREAGRLLDGFWLRDNAATDLPERLLNDWLVGWMRWQKATGVLIEGSPNAFSDYWQRRLRRSLERNVLFERIDERLVTPVSPMLFIGAVDVLSGEFKVFKSHRRRPGEPSWVFNDEPGDGIGVEAVLASAAIPPIFRAVRIGERVYWDGLFSQNPPIRELLDARPDEVWVIQINPSRMAPRPWSPRPGDEPASVVDVMDRRNALAGNISLNQELHYVEKINELVQELGEGERPRDRRLRLKNGKEYRPVVLRRIEMSWPLGAASKLDRNPAFIRRMMAYGEERAGELFAALAFERTWASRDPRAVAGLFTGDAEIHLKRPLFGEHSTYQGRREIEQFARRYLAGDESVRLDLTRKQVAGETVTWTVKVSPQRSGGTEPRPTEGTAEAVFERERVRKLTFSPNPPDSHR